MVAMAAILKMRVTEAHEDEVTGHLFSMWPRWDFSSVLFYFKISASSSILT